MVLFITVFANITMLFAQSNNITRFGIFEKEIKNSNNYENPYTDVDLMVVLTETFKKQHFIKGFYDGDGTWKIRFSPSNHSKWKYQYQFTDSEDIYRDEFGVSSRVNIQPIEVNPINSLWFKRAVDPFFVKGTGIDWSVLIKNDMTHLRDLKNMGFNLLFLKNVTDNSLSLFPLDYVEYEKFEPVLNWLYNNDFAIILPVYLFPTGQKPSNQIEWNSYLSYFFSRLGVYRNIMLYIPDNDNLNNISIEEKNQIISAITGNNPYQHPFAILNDNGKKLVIGNIQFNLVSNIQETKTKNTEAKIPLIKIVPDEINKDPKKLISYLCKAFTSGNSCIIDYEKLSNDLIQQQIKDLWRFFENIPYFEMKPVTSISNVGTCIGRENDEYVLFIEDHEKINLSLGNNYYKAIWVNPFNVANPIEAGIVSGDKELKIPEGKGSWLLHLSHKVSGYPLGIHLSWSEEPSESVTVTWTTVSRNNLCKVKYRKKGTVEWLEHTGTTEKSPGTVWIHSVVLRKLEPGSDYEYQVSADKSLDSIYSPVYQTRTAPTGVKSSFSFSFITDTGLEGRLDNNATGTERFIQEVLIEKPDFLLGGGDYGYANRDKRFKTVEGNIIKWFEQYQPVLTSMPFMEQYGNHELYLDERYEDWAPFFKHTKGFGDNRHYSFDVGNVHFTSFCLVDKLASKEELEWLEDDIKQARLKNQWIIVYHHEPIFAYGSSHPSKEGITNVIYPILRKYNVDLDISAHDQNYERTYPLSGTEAHNPEFNSNGSKIYKKGEGTVFLKVSPGGKKSEIGNIFPLFQDTQPPFIAMKDRSAHHLGIFNIRSGNSIEVKIYNVPEDSSPKYLIDHFIITK